MSDKHILAFPATTEHGLNSGVSGMTLRDYFAAKAMQAIFAKDVDSRWTFRGLSDEAYLLADAMLKARQK